MGFCWGVKKKLNFKVSIKHFKRTKGEAGYKISSLPGIIIRNTLGLLKIKFSKINLSL